MDVRDVFKYTIILVHPVSVMCNQFFGKPTILMDTGAMQSACKVVGETLTVAAWL